MYSEGVRILCTHDLKIEGSFPERPGARARKDFPRLPPLRSVQLSGPLRRFHSAALHSKDGGNSPLHLLFLRSAGGARHDRTVVSEMSTIVQWISFDTAFTS